LTWASGAIAAAGEVRAMNPLGIEFISVFGMPPVDYVRLAAELGCQHVSTALDPVPGYNPFNYPGWSLSKDKALRRDMVAAMDDTGVTISLGEGLGVFPGKDVSEHEADLDAMAELRVERLNTLSFDPDLQRSFDQFARLTEMAARRGIPTLHEFVPIFTVTDLPTAVRAAKHVGGDFALVIDTMHLMRSGSTPADLAALDPALIGYCQLCDAPRIPTNPDYLDEAMYERLPPGAGDARVAEVLRLLPKHVVVSLEVPQRSLVEKGVGARERLAPLLETTRRMLSPETAA
jgi:sugar phosphate isomerase/epimerase